MQGNGKPRTIYYVVDSRGWVQQRRLVYLKRYQAGFRFRLLSASMFRMAWRMGLLRSRPIYFSTWRTVHALNKAHSGMFQESEFRNFIAAVTSHSNIGGGLDPLNPIPGRQPGEALDLAVGLLKKFKVVTVNSLILSELLSSRLPNLIYCPNGVDTNFFTPASGKTYDPDRIRIGWVGKDRGPKNLPVIDGACKELNSLGVESKIIKIPRDAKKAPFTAEQMREFYRNIDYYLCASWNEGTPNPALEAGSCGTPIVTTCVGNMRELIKPGSNGFFIEPSVESIVSVFRKIRGLSREAYFSLSELMRDSIVKDWSWEHRIGNFTEVFSRLLNGNAR